ncbi:ABC-F family ATP-binding cassette domain-containing protein [Pedobacter sp. JY14-1]|uniref:ABC-F family ATP-binding cassette domain-containing protein n=1 Tax=Pedobacter sp. JY14-1 TaxID=3034151 RepID=UPI0023E1A429|nr:ABC-F family ATP-binding cassette domain-containing protein [Pedobacter sp. JY14-1]
MLILQDITYLHPNQDVLFSNISLKLNTHDKAALTGNNGTGKSTLLQIAAGRLKPAAGTLTVPETPWYIPQLTDQYNHLSIAEVLGVDRKLKAFREIIDGHMNEDNLALLNEDWTIEERSQEALARWGLDGISPDRKLGSLSGGQKTKVFLAGIQIHQPQLVLMDEPSNHLDGKARAQLYEYLTTCRETLLVVSHDRSLLNLLDKTYELSNKGITCFGGNYEFYASQKAIAREALDHDLKEQEKELRKAGAAERETLDRKQKLDARGKKKQEKAGLPTISMNTLRNNAEKSAARLKNTHGEKKEQLLSGLRQLRAGLPPEEHIRLDLEDPALHSGKVRFSAENINYDYGLGQLWSRDLSFDIRSGDRILLSGENGSGKTTLIRIILGELEPGAGRIFRTDASTLYIDQDYSLIDSRYTVYEQAQHFNTGKLQEHEIRTRLNRFLFGREDLDKPCNALSGGERMRLTLCALSIRDQAPDMIVLDEPTNNLDIGNIEVLTGAISSYRGTLLVVSHDAYFIRALNLAFRLSTTSGDKTSLSW